MLSKSDTFKSIRKAIDGVPVIDCHEHTEGYRFAPEYKESITSLIQGYVQSDLVSAGGGKNSGGLAIQQSQRMV